MKGYILRVLCAVALMTTFSACKKDNATPDNGTNNGGGSGKYYIRFKADGVGKEYNFGWAKMEMGDAGANHSAYFTAGIEGDTFKNSFSFRIYDSEAIKADVLYDQTIFAPTKAPKAYGVWSDDNGKLFVSFKTSADPVQPFQVKVSEIASNYVKGTFTGKVTPNNSGSEIISITDGEFYLKREN